MEGNLGIVFVFILVGVGFIIYVGSKKSKINKAKEIRQSNLKALHGIAEVVKKMTINLNASTNLKSKQKRAESIIHALNSASEYPEYKEVFENYDELLDQLHSVVEVLPVLEHLKKAHKYRFKKKDASEKNALLDALYEIEENKLSNREFETARAYDDETGEIVTIEMIENRLKELGWER